MVSQEEATTDCTVREEELAGWLWTNAAPRGYDLSTTDIGNLKRSRVNPSSGAAGAMFADDGGRKFGAGVGRISVKELKEWARDLAAYLGYDPSPSEVKCFVAAVKSRVEKSPREMFTQDGRKWHTQDFLRSVADKWLQHQTKSLFLIQETAQQ